MKKFLIILGLLLWWTAPAAAQCTGEAGANSVCANPNSSSAFAQFTGALSVQTVQVIGGTSVQSAGNGQIGSTSADGLQMIGNGSVYDVSLLARGGGVVCGIMANSFVVQCQVSSPGANTTADNLILGNFNVASSGNQQFSGALHFEGQGWKTNATAASQEADFIINEQPLQGAANPNSTLVFQSQVNSGGYTVQVVMTDGNGFPSLSTAVGGTAALFATAAQGDIQIGRSANSGFMFFGTGSGSGQYIGLNSLGNWVFGGNNASNTVNFGTSAGETVILETTNNGAPSGDTFTVKGSTITLQAFSGTTTVNCGVAASTNCIFTLAGSSGGAVSLIAQATASGTVTLPNGATTLAGLATTETFTAAQTFSNQIINTAARTFASATNATLDDVLVQAETTTITGNTGSPITALSKVHLAQPTLTDSSSVTVTTAATLTIDNAPAQAGSVTITNAYALNVAAGSALFGGKVFMSGLTAGSGTKAMCINATANEVQTDTSATICGISALRYKNLISEITPDQGLGILSLRSEKYRYKPEADQDDKIHVSLIADDMAAMNKDCANYSTKGVENYMDRCFEAYQVAYDKKLWEIIGKLTDKLPANDELREEIKRIPVH